MGRGKGWGNLLLVVEGFGAGNSGGGGRDLLEDMEDEHEGVGDWWVEMVVGQNIQFSGSCCDRVT